MPQPMTLQIDAPAARYLTTGTVGLRLRVTRSEARLKLNSRRRESENVRPGASMKLRGWR